jgi:S1-C subfamily serine protease
MPRSTCTFGFLVLLLAACSSTPPQPESRTSESASVVPGSIGAIVEPAGQGVRVRALAAEGPAARAGLHEGDLIVRCDGEPVSTTRAFNRCVLAASPGSRVRLEVLRDARSLAVDVNVIQLGTASRA